jgi:hypothetical protein
MNLAFVSNVCHIGTTEAFLRVGLRAVIAAFQHLDTLLREALDNGFLQALVVAEIRGEHDHFFGWILPPNLAEGVEQFERLGFQPVRILTQHFPDATAFLGQRDADFNL